VDASPCQPTAGQILQASGETVRLNGAGCPGGGLLDMEVPPIGLAKRMFHVQSIDADGVAVFRRVGRAKLVALIDRLDPTRRCQKNLERGRGPA
jgi:hypothetical protein